MSHQFQPRPAKKFQVQKETQDFTSKISQIVNAVACKKHGKDVGEPCWLVRKYPTPLAAICHGRVSMLYIQKG